ncbi:hypothetical protein [Virgibacillus pantothenticus]|nr:hypothetical protein [Virgibacillus pantothenticus]GIP63138.1 hypothetical protein J32TS6_16930 [Virgibacillus pantothenticus]
MKNVLVRGLLITVILSSGFIYHFHDVVEGHSTYSEGIDEEHPKYQKI